MAIKHLVSRAGIGVMLGLVVLPFLLTLGYTMVQWRRHEIDDARKAARLVVRHFASAYQGEIDGAGATLFTLARALDTADSNAAVAGIMEETLRQRRRYATVGTVTSSGELITRSRVPGSIGQAQAPPALRQALETRSLTITDPRVDLVQKRATVVAALATGAADGKSLHAVFAVIDLAWLPELAASEVLLPTGSVLWVFDRSGLVVARWPNASAWVGRNLGDDPLVARVLATGTEDLVEATSLDQVPRFYAAAPLAGATGATTLYLAIGIPQDTTFADADGTLRRALGASSVVLFGGLLAVWLLLGRLTKGYPALLGGARTLEQFSRAIEQSADSVLITNRDAIIEYVNPAFEEMTGFSRQEAIGATPRILRSGIHPPSFYDGMWSTILSGQPFRAMMTNRKRDGQLYDEEQVISPLRDASGAITHFVSTGRDITQRKRTQEAVRRLNMQLECESTRLASVLHDEAGQFLTAAHLMLSALTSEVPAGARARLEDVRRQLTQVEERLRQISHEVHPRIVHDLGLDNAVRFLCDSFSRRTGVLVSIESALDRRFDPGVETVMYRVVQEGLTNIGRHARATSATVTLGREGSTVVCRIRDDGVGIQEGPQSEGAQGGLGLQLMRDRIEAIGGTLTIATAPGQGTELRASVPVEV